MILARAANHKSRPTEIPIMKIKSYPKIAFIAAAVFSLAHGSQNTAPRTILITANDNMKYSLTHIDAHPGETLHVQFRNEGTLPKDVMAHNWVLLKAGKDANAYAAAALQAKDQDYQPKALAADVLASIPLQGAHREGEVTFEVPAMPGKYTYLCSFPAHCQIGMRGELIVK